MNLETILEMWSEDCKIEGSLDESSRHTPMLHAKYLQMLTTAKLLLRRGYRYTEIRGKTTLLENNSGYTN